jgi:hypothetical protein
MKKQKVKTRSFKKVNMVYKIMLNNRKVMIKPKR